jgi:hypothetical protein
MLQADDPMQCPHCSAVSAKRLVSRFARVRTEDQMIDALADEVEMMGEPDSPQAMRRFMREMGAAMDEDPYEMEQMFEEEMAAEEENAL